MGDGGEGMSKTIKQIKEEHNKIFYNLIMVIAGIAFLCLGISISGIVHGSTDSAVVFGILALFFFCFSAFPSVFLMKINPEDDR